MRLEGVLVDLVPFDARFESRMVTWLNGPMGEWWGQVGLWSNAAQRRRNEEWAAQPESVRQRHLRFGILTKDKVPIGLFSLNQIDPVHRMAEVGAGIGEPAYWGGGFGSDAMLLITDYAFRWLDLRRLWLTTREDNIRARRQVEKCGYVFEGLRRFWVYYGGVYRNMAIYGLLREEWPGREALVEQLGLRERARARGYGEALPEHLSEERS